MDQQDELGETARFDAMIARAAPNAPVSVLAGELASALPRRMQAARRRRARWTLTGALAGILTLGATTAVAAPLLLQPLPGYTKLASFAFGVGPGEPGVSCQTIIGIKPTPGDPEFDAAVVTEFATYIREQKFVVPVPDAARVPYSGSSGDLHTSPGFEALSGSCSEAVGKVYARFPHEVALSHSVTLQDSVSCSGHQ